MATTNISADIQNITGVSTANAQFIVSAQKFVVSSMPKELLWFASTQSSAISDGNGFDVQSADMVLSVERDGYPSSKVPFALSKWIADSTSLHLATAMHPKHYNAQGKVFIKPDPTGSANGYVYYIDYSQIDDDSDLRNAVIFNACSKEFDKLSVASLPSWTSPTVPVAPSAPSFGNDLTITAVPPSVPTINVETVDTSGWTAPTYTKPIISLPTSPTITDLSLSATAPISPSLSSSTISFSTTAPTYIKPIISLPALLSITDLSLSAVAPTSPNLSSSTISFSATAPTYTKPVLSLTAFPSLSYTYPSVPVVPIIAASTSNQLTWDGSGSSGGIVIDQGLISTPPVYTAPSLESRVSFSDYTSGLSETDPGTFSISTIAPLVPSGPTISYVNTFIGDAVSVAQDSIATAQDAYTGETSITPGSASYTSPSPTVSTSSTDILDMVSGAAGQTADQIDFDKWWDIVGDFIETEEDVELAGAQIAKINAYLSAFQAEVQDASAAMQASIETARELTSTNSAIATSKTQAGIAKMQASTNAAVQKMQNSTQAAIQKMQLSTNINIQNAAKVMEASIQDYSLQLQRYQAQLQEYQISVTKEIQEYQQKLALYQAELGVAAQNWAKEETDKIQRFSQEIQDAISAFNDDSAEYQATLQVAIENAKLAEAGDQILLQKFSQEINIYQQQVNKVVANSQAQIAEWQQRNTVSIQKFGADIQNELNEFNKENAAYQAQLQVSIEDARLNSQDDVQILQKYINDVQKYQSQVNAEVQVYTVNEIQKEIGIWQADLQSKLTRYQSDIQNELNAFNEENTAYQAQLQISIENARLNSQDDVQILQKYANDVQEYQSEVNAEVQVYTVNEIQKEIGIWQADLQSKLAQYQSDIQNELNEFNKEQVIYQAEVQTSIQDSQLADAQETKKIQLYQAQLSEYNENINKEVQTFVNTLQKDSQEYNANIALYNTSVQAYQIDVSDQTQLNAVAVQNATLYDNLSKKYYSWSVDEVQRYVQFNSKMISKTIAAQSAQQYKGK